MNNELQESQVETQKQLADGERGNAAKVQIWRREIKFAQEYAKNWTKEAENYVKDYENQEQASMHIWESPDFAQPKRYNVFWANTQTLKPLLFSQLPAPNITQRYFDDDEVARIAAEMMERTISYFLECADAEEKFKQSRDDYLVVGRGCLRVVYEPEQIIELDETETIVNEEGVEIEQAKTDVDKTKKAVSLEFVKYEDILISTEQKWKDLRWIGFKHLMSKEQLKEKFGSQKASKVDLTATIEIEPSDATRFKDDVSIFKRAVIWEIWDKTEKKVHWITEDGEEVLLESIDDPYQLQQFFPVPKFLGIHEALSSLLPIPLYRMYRSQALELNEIDKRSRSLTQQLKFVGIYKATAESQDINSIFNGEDGQMSPAKTMMNVDDIKKGIMFKPIVEIAAVIDKLEQRKIVLINNIREITGISDIVRGVSAPQETATAQELKGNFAISRIQPLQRQMELFVRDAIRLIAEMIVENYDITELAKMANLKIVDLDEIAQQTKAKIEAQYKEAAQLVDINDPERAQKLQLLQQQGQAGFAKTMKKAQLDLKGFACTPEQLEQIDQLIKSDKLRTFSIDIETDSTIKADQQQERSDRLEFVKALNGFAGAMLPLVNAGVLTQDAFNKFLTFTAAPFKVSRNVQELLIKDEEDQEQKPDPELQKQQIEAQLTQQKLQVDAQKNQMDYEIAKEKNNIEKARVHKDIQEFQDKLEFEDINKEADRRAATAQEIIKQRTQILNN